MLLVARWDVMDPLLKPILSSYLLGWIFIGGKYYSLIHPSKNKFLRDER